MRQTIKTAIKIFTAVSILFGCIPMSFAYSEGENTAVSIYTAQDLMEFSKGCSYDGYSRGRTFVLMSDIDLSEKEFTPVEIFCGVFDGNGHSIMNAELEFKGSGKGFFINVAKDGEVRNLNVSGKVRAINDPGEKNTVKDMLGSFMKNVGVNNDLTEEVSITGGLVGTNEGKLLNCGYDGSVKGKKQVGGIAGYNRGIIEGCLNAAELDGLDSVGGVAGKNSGIIRNSKNAGVICEKANENARNIGGIAGLSDGAVEGCVNDGAVGCKNFGSNVGGIAGKQSGNIAGCSNNAVISGGKSVGGIAGRFAPYTDIDLSDGNIKQEIEDEVNRVRDDINGYTDDIKGRVTDITDIVEKLAKGGWIADDIDRLLDGRESVSDGRRRVLDSISDAIDGSSSGKTGGLSDTVDRIAGDITDSLKDRDTSAKDALNDVKDAAKNAADSVKDAVEAGSDRKDALTDEAKNAIRDVNGSLSNMADSVSEATGKFGNISSDISRLTGELSNSISLNRTDQHKIANELLDKLEDLDTNVLNSIANSMEDAAYSIEYALRELRKNSGKVSQSLIDSLERFDKQISEALDSIKDMREKVDEAKKKLQDLLDKLPKSVAQATDEKLGQEETVRKTADGISSIVETIEGALTTTVSAAENDINVSDDEIRESIKDIASIDIRIKREVAGEPFDMAVIDSCYNGGAVEAVSAAGGIVGNIGIESAVKSGESLKLPDGTLLSASSVVKAVVDSSISDGSVQAKNKYAGGIAGTADLGIIKNALSDSDVCVTDGDFAGGIAGNSGGRIEKCIAVSQVSGKSDVGGIAGKGEDIKSCYALPTIEEKVEHMGAVAGSLDGIADSNYFIDEGLSGVNGTDYSGKAVALSAYDMTGRDTLPESMAGFSADDWYVGSDDLYLPQNRRLSENMNPYNGNLLKTKSSDSARFHFKVQFINDGNVIKILDAEYGDILPEGEIPPLEKRSGSDPRWSRDVTKPILRNTKIEAVYDTALSVISTKEEPPLLLVEGNFGDGTAVNAKEAQLAADFGEDYQKGNGYSFSITPEKYADRITKVRIRDDAKKGNKIGIIEEGNAKILNCVRDGNYLVFEVDKPCDFVILYEKGGYAGLVIWIAAGIIILGALIYIMIYRRKKRGMVGEKHDDARQEEKKQECDPLPEADCKCLCTAHGGKADGENHSDGHCE